MNTEQKQKLFAQYYGVECGIIESLDGLYTIDMISSVDRLRLTHPNNITDEHCVELFDLLHGEKEFFEVYEKVMYIKDCILSDINGYHIHFSEKIISFLRNHAYIFQFEGMSIEQLVESGEVELI